MSPMFVFIHLPFRKIREYIQVEAESRMEFGEEMKLHGILSTKVPAPFFFLCAIVFHVEALRIGL